MKGLSERQVLYGSVTFCQSGNCDQPSLVSPRSGKTWKNDPPANSTIRWMTLISYAISIPLGIRKAVRDGSPFDVWTSGVVIVGRSAA
jgi:hypothetical protein